MKIDEFIKNNPNILDDEEHEPDIKKVFRDHYSNNVISNGRTRWVDYIPVNIPTSMELKERGWHRYETCISHDEDELDVVGGEDEALWNID